MGDVGASLQGAGSSISEGDDGAGAGAGPGAGAGASAYGVGGAGASAAGTSVSSVSAAITVWLCLSAAAKLCNYVGCWIRRSAAVFYVQNDCGLRVLPRETECRGGFIRAARLWPKLEDPAAIAGTVVARRKEASEAWRKTPVHRKRSRETRGTLMLAGVQAWIEGARGGVAGGRHTLSATRFIAATQCRAFR